MGPDGGGASGMMERTGSTDPALPLNERVLFSPFLLGTPLFLLASAFFGWLAAADAYPVLDRHAAGLAWTTPTCLAHRNLLHSR